MPCRTRHRTDSWARTWPCGKVPRGVPGALVGCVGSCQSPLVKLVATHTEPEPLCSASVTRLHCSYGLLRLLPRSVFYRQVARVAVLRARSPVLRRVASVRAAPNTPAGASERFGSPTRTPLVFAVIRAARLPHQLFRGLLRLPSRCGPYSCSSITHRLLSLELRRRRHRLRLPGSYPGIPTIPEVGLPPTVTPHLCTAHTDKALL